MPSPDSPELPHSFCMEIESNHKKLFLSYDDPEAWALGHACKMLIVKSLDDL